jgi:hypothetical protein
VFQQGTCEQSAKERALNKGKHNTNAAEGLPLVAEGINAFGKQAQEKYSSERKTGDIELA